MTLALDFLTPDFGWEEYKEGLLKRAAHDNQATALIDPDSILPPDLRAGVNMFPVLFDSYKQAELTVAFIGILSVWSIFTEQDGTESSYHRRIYLPNFHILHYLEKNFVQQDGKIQLEAGPIIRINLYRPEYNLEIKLKEHGLNNRTRKRIDGILQTERIPHQTIWDNLAKILRKHRFLNREKMQSLYKVWLGITQGHPPGYRSRRLGFERTATWLHMDTDELEEFLSNHIKTDPRMYDLSSSEKKDKMLIPHLKQCATLEGRPTSIIHGMDRLNFKYCVRCLANITKTLVSCPSKNDEHCSKLDLLGIDIVMERRTEFPAAARRSIQKRDGESCLICQVIGDSGSRIYQVAHITPAFYSKNLTERDGFMICHIHNGSAGMSDRDLSDYYPEAIPLAKQIGLNV